MLGFPRLKNYFIWYLKVSLLSLPDGEFFRWTIHVNGKLRFPDRNLDLTSQMSRLFQAFAGRCLCFYCIICSIYYSEKCKNRYEKKNPAVQRKILFKIFYKTEHEIFWAIVLEIYMNWTAFGDCCLTMKDENTEQKVFFNLLTCITLRWPKYKKTLPNVVKIGVRNEAIWRQTY